MDKKYSELLTNCRVLLAEDDKKTIKTFSEILEIYFEDVYIADNGEKAIEIYHTEKPDIIITDIKMPFMNGLELVSFIRKIDKQIPIIVISAYTEKDDLISFTTKHLSSFLIKPVAFEDMEHSLELCAKEIEEQGLIEYRFSKECFYSFSKKALFSLGEVIPLQPKEFYFLELLIKNRNRLVTKEQIEDVVYDGETMSASAISNLASKIRKKIGNDAIKTISSLGFMLVKTS